MPGIVYVDPTNPANTFRALNASIPPPAGYVLQSGSDGSLDRPPQTFKPYGSGGFPQYPTDGSYTDVHGTFTPSGGTIR